MNKKYQNLHQFVFAFLAVIIFFAFNISAIAAQEKASEDNTNQATESPTPTPVPVPTPIPIGEVVTQAEATSKSLEKIKEGLDKSPSVAVIEAELPNLKEELDSSIMETSNLLSARPSLETLRTVEQKWNALAKNVPVWKGDLKAQITVFDNYIKELQNLKEEWQKTLDSLTNPKVETSGNSNTNLNSNTAEESSEVQAESVTEVPPEILEKIQATIDSINQTQKLVEEKRGELLTLQTRVSKEETRINETLASITEVREEALTHLFVQDSPAIWNARRQTDSISNLSQETTNSLGEQGISLSDYAFRQSDKFVLHAAVFLLFFGILIWARRRLRPMVEADPELKPAFSVFEMPVAGAMILSIMLSGWFYPQGPRMLSAILGAAALIPGIIYLRKIIEKPLFPILNALVVFYFIDQLRQITATLPLLSRILFLAEMLGAIIFLIWFLRSKSLSKKVEVQYQRIFIITRKAVPYLLVFFSIAFIANLFGYVSLSNVVGNSVLGSSYIALILYTAIQIVKSLVIFALRVQPLSSLGMVKTHREMLKRKVFSILKWFGIITWGILTLNLFSIRETLFGFFREWLTAELVIGSIAISLSDVIIFGVTVWLAFALSKVIRFVLEEDVYTRVNLAGGIPYAISTMVHYVLLVVGFILAIAALGIDLTKFTILAGAFGVGLGFGLQTIVNNFVSGLILLFERPVKVDDVVQIGTNLGDLKRIGLRASVLRTYEGSEVIVPNGQLISEEVTNWTFSDKQKRIDINVGVAYGNKPRQVLELLKEAALSHKDVLQEPPPRSLYVGFGENSLDFQLRVWTSEDLWVVIKSDLTLAIHEALDEAEIEIPFPQRDLHIRSVDKGIMDKLSEKTGKI